MNGDEIDDVELPVNPFLPENLWPETGSSRVMVDLAAVSDRGLVRENNEDHYLVLRFSRSMEFLFTNLPADERAARADEVGYGFAVADGMGGR